MRALPSRPTASYGAWDFLILKNDIEPRWAEGPLGSGGEGAEGVAGLRPAPL